MRRSTVLSLPVPLGFSASTHLIASLASLSIRDGIRHTFYDHLKVGRVDVTNSALRLSARGGIHQTSYDQNLNRGTLTSKG
jgi:hypothetical protein